MSSWRPLRSVLLATTALAPLALATAIANPLGPNVVGGTANVTGTGTANVTVNQTSQNAIINWQTFNISAGETTRFNQPGSTSTILNRVTGQMGPSSIYGTITANGRVFIVNPDGILIGHGASINAAGFLATTHDISNADFMANRWNFNIPGRPNASIVNEGTITATNAGFAALVAPGVRNSGTITARFGKIGLASANGFTLDLYGDNLITLGVNDTIATQVLDVSTGQTLSSLVKNDGVLKANGGRVELTAAAARVVVDSVINTSGVIEARTIGRHNGKIVLGAATASTKPAGVTAPQNVKVSGTLSVASKKGKAGTVQITGEHIALNNAKIDATGYLGGGTVLIGGDIGGGVINPAVAKVPQAKLQPGPVPKATTVTVDGETVINASATGIGDAGKVVVWSDGSTTFAGTIVAQGPSGTTVSVHPDIANVVLGGNGGFVEVSGKQSLTFNGTVNLGAPHGKSGTLLLDPLNAYIENTPGVGVITASSIQTALLTSDVVITTDNFNGSEAGDLFVNAPITWANANSLWLTAYRNVVINANITNNFNPVGPVGDNHNINIIADNMGTGIGTVIFAPGAIIKSRGEINIAFNPSVNPVGSGINPTSYVNPVEDFSSHVDTFGGIGTLTQYMKVNTPADLQNVTNNLNGNYVLGTDIDMTGVTGFVPIGNGSAFNGKFVGIGNSIFGLQITSSLSNVGLFSQIGSNAEVGNISLSGFTVTATAPGGANVGTLTGSNAGNVHDVDIGVSILTATPSGLVPANVNIGGVVGLNTGSMQYIDALGVVISIPNVAGTWHAGGIAGMNAIGGNISNSLALAGIVSDAPVGSTVDLGGLVGRNSGAVQKSWTFGTILDNNTNPVATVGGVIGTNEYYGTVNQVHTWIPDGVLVGAVVGAVIGNNINYNPGGVAFAYFDSTLFTGPGVGIGTPSGVTGLPTTTFTNGNLPAGYSSSDWMVVAGFYPILQPHDLFSNAVLVTPSGSQQTSEPQITPPPPTYVPTTPPQEPSGSLIVLTSLTPPAGPGPGVTTGPIATVPQGQPFAPPQFARAVVAFDGTRLSGMPPLNETRFFRDEIVFQMRADTSPEEIARIAQQFGLTVIGSETLTALGRKAIRFRIGAGRSLRDIIRLADQNPNVIATPNYVHTLAQAPATQAPAALPPVPDANRGDAAQYTLEKLQVHQIHRLASGAAVTIAVVDSEVDKDHSELVGTIAQRFDAVGVDDKAHSHGTAMVGAIVSRDRLLGVAPRARILAVRSFSQSQTTAEGTTFNILRGIEWAVSQGARVINMSFAGPFDPALEKALKAAYEKGVILVAAAGNAGPKSAPLFPGADVHVIGVTATDNNDRAFKGANVGGYIALAAPGVEILAPAPQETYQMSTGTSIATAHVSAVVALMLERDPTLKPDDVRKILQETAVDLGPKGRDNQFGWGLINPQKALAAVEARKKSPTATTR